MDPMKNVHIDDAVDLYTGDCVDIGEGVSIVGRGRLRIGDYTKIHRNTLIVCLSDVTIGHNCWIGERSTIDGTAELTIGNNVGIGIGSSIFTHISFGDAFSGCRLRNAKPVTIADEAWLVGQVMVQACNIASRAVIMPMSNVIKSVTKPNSIWSGNPIEEVTEKLGGAPWKDVTIEQRHKHFMKLLSLYENETRNDPFKEREWHDRFVCVDTLPSRVERLPGMTYFEMDRRIYTKQGDLEEQHFMKWLLRHNKAKFTPEE
jgi:acetyltransferase-like isoleucine patch superfamily enzyme